ncbi:MAG: hypothetical protein ACLR6I_12590 [Waltera sp.]
MAITGIGYGRTFVYEAQKRVNAGDVQSAQGSATETAESRFAESIEELAKEDNTVKTPVTRGVQLARSYRGQRTRCPMEKWLRTASLNTTG